MWRVQGFVGRVLHRCHGSSPLRLPQNHHVEDEVINTSSVLSNSLHSSDTSSQKEEDGERRRKQKTFQFGHAELPRYTALDAVGWGAAAVMFMQVCKRIHSRFSSAEASSTAGALTAPTSLHKCGYRILLEILSRHDVLPRGSGLLCLQEVSERQSQDQPPAESSSSSSVADASPRISLNPENLTAECSISDHQWAPFNQDSSVDGESLSPGSCSQQNDANRDSTDTKDVDEKDLSGEEGLTGAALNLRHVGDTSIPVIFNIIGLESAKCENYKEAFTSFLVAAQQGYSKAQFNVAVCYEKGRGVGKDKDKALHYYWQAAVGGHRQAQYRYAKLLLTSRGHTSLDELNTVINLLEQAAAAGITKAQLCLASVYSQGLVMDENKSIQYLEMAAASGDDTALLLLGKCYQSGFGVPQNLKTASELYKRAAQAGNKEAQSLLPPHNKERTELRSIHSAPCFSSADHQLQQSLPSLTSFVPPSTSHPTPLPFLPHSWSTGNLHNPLPLSSTPLHGHTYKTQGAMCQWTVGVG
ncbi:death ligand signal enhancer isoform X2 [Betta splendens]|uniref:Death ligand signal enhancer isoform X2 n=1 Tax=Betta splendens TaxID=158456 RepID=A0A6P7NQT3_BETSP|nr:death ligand signal enhancer isoform X2 [Betta splendens]